MGLGGGGGRGLLALALCAVLSERSALAVEGDCATLTEAGSREDAVAACWNAWAADARSLEAEGAYVRALLLGAGPPDAEIVAAALAGADDMRKRAPHDPWGYVAYCEVAARIGDTVMLEKYVRELDRVAPKHRETQRVKEALVRLKAGFVRPVLGVLLVLIPAVATLAHAIRRALHYGEPGAPVVRVAAILVLALGFVPMRAGAEEPTPQPRSTDQRPSDPGQQPGVTPQSGNIGIWPIDDKDPESSVPSEAKRNADPVEFGYWLQDVTVKGQKAAKRGDHESAVRYFRAVVKAVPDRAIGLSRLCDEYEALGEREKATAACKVALQMEGVTFHEYVHYVNLMLEKPGSLSSTEVADLQKIFEHLREDPAVGGDIYGLECKMSVRTGDTVRLERCVADAKAKAPDAPATLVYEWALALAQGKYAEARQLVEKARSKGGNAAALERMEHQMQSQASRHGLVVLYGLLCGICVIAAASVSVLLVRRRGKKTHPGVDMGAPVDVGS
jgi:tetratricopeptide (TPR) repeat protein